MCDRELELLYKTAKTLSGSPLTQEEEDLLMEYYTSSTGSVFNRMRMAIQMVLHIDTSMFELKKRGFDPTIETLKELRVLADAFEKQSGQDQQKLEE